MFFITIKNNSHQIYPNIFRHENEIDSLKHITKNYSIAGNSKPTLLITVILVIADYRICNRFS